MEILQNLKTTYQLLCKGLKGQTHKERMEDFYSSQAGNYDNFRPRILHGREELMLKLPLQAGMKCAEIGAGTGYNWEIVSDHVKQFEKLTFVDLSISLLEVAKKRAVHHSWNNVEFLEGDMTQKNFEEESLDLILASYSLTMSQDWISTLIEVKRALKKGGMFALVDFYEPPKRDNPSPFSNSWWSRWFYRAWCEGADVFTRPETLGYLQKNFETEHLSFGKGKIPHIPLVRPPYFLWTGRKPH